MSNFSFKLPNGESFEIKMPSGASLEQAQAIFKQQVDTGGLVGFKVGDAMNAATQAADGLAAAAAQAKQGAAGLLDKLSNGTNLGSLSASVGTAGAGALNQVSSALSGSIPSVSSLTTGASAAINGAISGVTSAAGAATTGLGSLTSAVSSGLTGAAAQAGTVANNAIKSIAGAIGGTPTQGINVADFAKQGPSLGDIGNLSKSAVTGVLAQANKLVGQTADQLSNLGLGKFGLDASQLEKSGHLKPGTAAAFLKTAEADLTAVLKSPLPWTGKDGVKGLGDILGNGKLQDKIQQGLMKTGLSDVKQLGLPVDKLNPSALGGVATLAAKDPSSAVAALSGGASGGSSSGLSSLTGVAGVAGLGALSGKVNDVMSNSAYAVNLTEGKVEPPLKQEEPAPVATNTVNSDTVDAAGKRVIGNDKVPDTNPTWKKPGYAEIKTWLDWIAALAAQATALQNRVDPYKSAATLTQEEWNVLNEELKIIRAEYTSKYVGAQNEIIAAIEKIDDSDTRKILGRGFENFKKTLNIFIKAVTPLVQDIKALANKIGAPDGA